MMATHEAGLLRTCIAVATTWVFAQTVCSGLVVAWQATAAQARVCCLEAIWSFMKPGYHTMGLPHFHALAVCSSLVGALQAKAAASPLLAAKTPSDHSRNLAIITWIFFTSTL